MACCWAGVFNWTEAKRHIEGLKTAARTYEVPLTGPLEYLVLYLDGVYHQGIGDFDTALRIFRDAKFKLSPAKTTTLTSTDQIERDLAILATLNTLWILQDKGRQDLDRNAELMEALEPFCVNHPNLDIRTAFHLSGAMVEKNPPLRTIDIKASLRLALDCAQKTQNTQFLAITLCVMCNRFFTGVLGVQSEKSAKAASVQAGRTGNVLWMSVADKLLAQFYESQGRSNEAQDSMASAQRYSEQALSGV